MNMPLLNIQPSTLKFVVYLNKESSCVVQLTNTSQHYVAFKVKTTLPKKYYVRPNPGIVAPKSSCEFTVTMMQSFKELPQDIVCKDKFLIQSIVVPPDTTDKDITSSMFSKVEGKHIEEIKLRVTYVLPSDSPELLPINGTSKIPKESEAVQLQTTDQITKGLVEIKLVKDIEEVKLKVDALESMLKQADSTILKLMEERSISSSQYRQSLQHELAELRIYKIVKEAQIGFPLLFVYIMAFISIVALISICIGYSLRT